MIQIKYCGRVCEKARDFNQIHYNILTIQSSSFLLYKNYDPKRLSTVFVLVHRSEKSTTWKWLQLIYQLFLMCSAFVLKIINSENDGRTYTNQRMNIYARPVSIAKTSLILKIGKLNLFLGKRLVSDDYFVNIIFKF